MSVSVVQGAYVLDDVHSCFVRNQLRYVNTQRGRGRTLARVNSVRMVRRFSKRLSKRLPKCRSRRYIFGQLLPNTV